MELSKSTNFESSTQSTENLPIKDLDYYKSLGIFNKEQLSNINHGLQQNLDVSIYGKSEFSSDQMYQITIGQQEGLDVSVYAKSEFDAGQMVQLRLGLELGLDVTVYANPEFDTSKMDEIRRILLNLEDALEGNIKVVIKNRMTQEYMSSRYTLRRDIGC